MTGWVTYARPFAIRRRSYKIKRDQWDLLDPKQERNWERMDACREAIEWMWSDFVRAMQKDEKQAERLNPSKPLS